jgi:hypothetical protein
MANHSIERTVAGVPSPAAHVKRWAPRNAVRAWRRSSQFPPTCPAVARCEEAPAFGHACRPHNGRFAQASEWAVRPSAASALLAAPHCHPLWWLVVSRCVATRSSVSPGAARSPPWRARPAAYAPGIAQQTTLQPRDQTTAVGAGCPSFGGQRATCCPSPPSPVATRWRALCGAVADRREEQCILVTSARLRTMKIPRAAQPFVPADVLRPAASARG